MGKRLFSVFGLFLLVALQGGCIAGMQGMFGMSDTTTILPPGRERTPDTVYLNGRAPHHAYFRGIKDKNAPYTGEARYEPSGVHRCYYPHGYGKYGTSGSKATYVGEWKKGEAHGQGRWEDAATGEYFEGEWKNGRWGSFGEHGSPGGEVYKGGWQDGRHHGVGVTRYADGSRHEGFYAYGKRSGYGELLIPKENATALKPYEGKGLWRDGWYVVRAYFRDDTIHTVIPWVPAERESFLAELKKLGITVETAVRTAPTPDKPDLTHQLTVVRMNGKQVAEVCETKTAIDQGKAWQWRETVAPWSVLCEGSTSYHPWFAPSLEEAVHAALQRCGRNLLADRQGEIRRAAVEEERRIAEEKAAAAAREQQARNALFSLELSSEGMDHAKSGRERGSAWIFSADAMSQNIVIESSLKGAPGNGLAYPVRVKVRYRLRYPVTTTMQPISLTQIEHQDITRTYTLESPDSNVSDSLSYTLQTAMSGNVFIVGIHSFLSGDPELVADVLEVKEQ